MDLFFYYGIFSPVNIIETPVSFETSTERRLAVIWAELFSLESVSRGDRFFELGGDSLIGLKLFTKIREKFGCELPVATLYQNQTIQKLAKCIDHATSDKKPYHFVVPIQQSNEPSTPLFLIHGGDGGTLFYKDFINHINAFPTLYSVEAPLLNNLSRECLEPTIEATAELYCREILKTIPAGQTISLGGYSFGGVLALELAKHLVDNGVRVETLFMFDTSNPANENDYVISIPAWLKGRWNRFEGNLVSRAFQFSWSIWNQFLSQLEGRKLRRKIKKHQDQNLPMGEMLRMDSISLGHYHVMVKYQPSVYRGNVCLFRAKSEKYVFDREMGWKDYLPNLEVVDIEGTHTKIFASPNVEVLINRFNESV